MHSSAPDVDTYLAEVPDECRPVLTALRDTCRAELTGFTETMRYGMPTWERDGETEVAWASQARHLSLYVLRTHRESLAGFDVGKGCIRYRRPEQVDLQVVRRMLADTAATRGPVC